MLLYARRQRTELVTLAVLAILWGGLVLTLSRSSLGALLVGLGALAALRWRVGRAVFVAVGVVAVAAAAIAISPTTFGLNQGLNGASSGRPGLVSGGIDLFGSRPLWGYGSGSFETQYAKRHHEPGQTTTASHTIPVTIAAEQGLIGELAYVAFVVAALVTLLHRARAGPGPGGHRRRLHRAAVPHAALRRLPGGPDHLDPPGHRRRARPASRRGFRLGAR